MSGLILRMLPLAKMVGILCMQERLMADCIKFTINYSYILLFLSSDLIIYTIFYDYDCWVSKRMRPKIYPPPRHVPSKM